MRMHNNAMVQHHVWAVYMSLQEQLFHQLAT